ncbi:putative mitogen-activated protein kinase kinase kinase [Rosa chinensis]|uniref:Putative mitogen-activated protein kinase kinase kinase n=1 Tax=Rosa chinensis TaxID=74649 RepID=A0A2P6PAW3_ROSCH|nr:mitogen-activated protein kinase kinase kinase 3 [Rosa chinensis]XP_024171116.1 mitogen-activated protein kinase kinase kinase 3 [Rosa chinensis]XP_024171118.1 mitogen-activated protein kinase kinase kinase 3 [Rosa chinensis]XP_040368096.1 mitogen-activated protein kinase kinase kinase 3 [Rosa chinensis]XP_040368097.1 mitogen-activated protein kinase kinase kinase 3 [Rosa chinensis]PRQ19064.1 putative mitogen-activated protein kinase kinase kinase [Rosa chinensis]
MIGDHFEFDREIVRRVLNCNQITNVASMLSFKGSPYWMAPEVAAIFKIGNSKGMPDIPDYLSHDAKNFVRLCLQWNPSERATASQLLDHPSIREQMTTRSSNKLWC